LSLRDFIEYAPVAQTFRYKRLASTFATNSIKLYPLGFRGRGAPYIWIDPPWQITSGKLVVLNSDSYPMPSKPGGRRSERLWLNMATKLSGFRNRYFLGVTHRAGNAEFRFSGGVAILASAFDSTDPDMSYDDWYADRTLAPSVGSSGQST
jgi:hypothetical protein